MRRPVRAMGLGQYLKDVFRVAGYYALGFLLVLAGVLIILAPFLRGWDLSLSGYAAVLVVASIFIAIGGLVVRYTKKRVAPRYKL